MSIEWCDPPPAVAWLDDGRSLIARRRLPGSRISAKNQPASGRAKVEEPPHFHVARHHEDAGIGYNVFRATVAANAS